MAPIGLKCIFKTLFLKVHTFIYFFLRVPLYKEWFYAFWNPASNAIIHKNILAKLNIYQEENGKNASGMAATRGRSKNKGHTCVLL